MAFFNTCCEKAVSGQIIVIYTVLYPEMDEIICDRTRLFRLLRKMYNYVARKSDVKIKL